MITKLLETILDTLQGKIKRKKGWQDEECEIAGGDAQYLIDEVVKMDQEITRLSDELEKEKKKVVVMAPVPPIPQPVTN